jgi:hypothetical protein
VVLEGICTLKDLVVTLDRISCRERFAVVLEKICAGEGLVRNLYGERESVYHWKNLYSGRYSVALKGICKVEECLYCGRVSVLWKSVCTVEECLYCGRVPVLWKSVCTVKECLYCGRVSVLSKSVCSVEECLYCGRVSVPWKSVCTVEECLCRGRVSVLWKSVCTVEVETSSISPKLRVSPPFMYIIISRREPT